VNPRISLIEPSLIRAINDRKKPGDIDLGLGEPTLPPDMEAFEYAMAWTRENGSRYAPNAGQAELRELIAAYLGRAEWAIGGLSAGNVCVTVGSEEALYLAVKTVCDPARHEMLVIEPGFLAYPKIATLEGVATRSVALDPDNDFQPDAGRVLEAVQPETRLIVLNTPTNPTGRVWPAEELRKLAAGLAASGREDVFILADEVYGEIHAGQEYPATIATWHSNTLVAGSLSKSNALTGLRVGWLAGPAEVITAAIKVHQFLNTGVATFAQRVAVFLFREGRLGDHAPIYRANREHMLAAANRSGLHVIPPEGGFYGFLRLPSHCTGGSIMGGSISAAERIIEDKRVITVPGVAFGAAGEGWIRISWVAPVEQVEEGIRRIGEWTREELR
jgi:aspartate/methionine/tyrosine aminotransferase